MARVIGELLITAGIVVLLFVVYVLYVTNWETARGQGRANADLDDGWRADPRPRPDLVEGEAFTRLYIPRFGTDYRYTIQQGVGRESLNLGPGHYVETALPGEPGNFGVAGHRIGRGAPFNKLDRLHSCDAVVVETATSFFVYRVLPMSEEVPNWEWVRQANPKCAKVSPLGGPYDGLVGRRIVTPDRGDAVAPVPYKPTAQLAKAQQASLITLTTCHPEFGNSERMIIHGVLERQVPKVQVPGGYEALLERIGEA